MSDGKDQTFVERAPRESCSHGSMRACLDDVVNKPLMEIMSFLTALIQESNKVHGKSETSDEEHLLGMALYVAVAGNRLEDVKALCALGANPNYHPPQFLVNHFKSQ